LSATPIDITRLMQIDKPVRRVRYEYEDHGDPTLEAIDRLESYEFVYGSEARRWVFDAGTDLQGLPWLAVYRRAGLRSDTRLR